MVDVHTKLARSRNNGGNQRQEHKARTYRALDTTPGGLSLPIAQKGPSGEADIVFASKLSAIVVHGCFWHMHDCRYGRVVPATNALFWQSKSGANVERDRRTEDQLKGSG